MRFRSRCKYQDQKSAMIYFRNLVEAHAAGPNGTQYLRDALGLEATYAPVFEHSLRLIREEDLSEISWDEPLGRGANGIVFSAIYHRHPGMLASSKAAESRVSVVLKDILSRSGNLIAARKKLIKEVKADQFTRIAMLMISSWTLHSLALKADPLAVLAF